MPEMRIAKLGAYLNTRHPELVVVPLNDVPRLQRFPEGRPTRT